MMMMLTVNRVNIQLASSTFSIAIGMHKQHSIEVDPFNVVQPKFFGPMVTGLLRFHCTISLCLPALKALLLSVEKTQGVLTNLN